MRVLSLFAGCGGLDLDLSKLALRYQWRMNMINQYLKHLKKIFQTKLIKKSIAKLELSELPKNIDGIVGGPPCQSWSEAGKQLGINDRGKLFHEYIRILDGIKLNSFWRVWEFSIKTFRCF